ncbi:hypothetical protein E2320_004967 [Naja naja]|nr:hypothetical protein E2320_004967 [Naja naja]
MRLAGTLRAAAGGGGWRERFECGGRDVARWFPGHMARGTAGARGGRESERPPPGGAAVATAPLSPRRAEGHEEEPAQRGRPAGALAHSAFWAESHLEGGPGDPSTFAGVE